MSDRRAPVTDRKMYSFITTSIAESLRYTLRDPRPISTRERLRARRFTRLVHQRIAQFQDRLATPALADNAFATVVYPLRHLMTRAVGNLNVSLRLSPAVHSIDLTVSVSSDSPL